MTDLYLYRHSYAPTETMGRLSLPSGTMLHTIEKPWIWHPSAGSKPFGSCVPDGVYDLIPHRSDKYGKTWALHNPALKVWHKQEQMDGPGRYACLIHVANYASEVVGCIAPGKKRVIMNGSLAVVSSGPAMQLFRQELGAGQFGHRLIIQPSLGADISRDG